ncbi:MAG: TonB-dependent receptor [bacterium]|nr:TonB-dependent receptor [bacterium]
MRVNFLLLCVLVSILMILPESTFAQGVTTASLNGIVQDADGNPLPGANVMAEHIPSGSQYGAATRDNGFFNLPNLRVGGPYKVTVSYVGFNPQVKDSIFLSLGQNFRLEFILESQAVTVGEIVVTAEQDAVLNSNRTGAATYVDVEQIQTLPTVKRSIRDLTRLDPRSDGNYSFGGKNWLYNNISLDGSYFNNPFGLDDPAPGGQTNSEPVPFDAVEQVQVSIAPFDVRQGGFTGAGVNVVTKSGTNRFQGSLYSFLRNESLLGNTVSGNEVIANPDLFFNQSGFSLSGPIVQDKLFFFLNGELERREDPGTNFVADDDGTIDFGESRVRASVMDSIRTRMKEVYNYETGEYEGFVHDTENEKILLKLDWNINESNNLSFRYNRLDARRDLPPHPFVLSSGGRGPNETSLPFQNSGYQINNKLNSYAVELNSRSETFANRFFASYNVFRDNRDPFSEPFPTIQIDVDGVNYTTIGHEPFSIHNILDQDVLQITDNFSYFLGNHVLTAGSTFEYFSFFNAFNIFRYGLFMVPAQFGGTTFGSLEEFFDATDPNSANFIDFRSAFVNPVSSSPFKGENIEVGQLSFYVQDEFSVSPVFNLTAGIRVDLPMYFTDPVDNPFSRSLNLLDENDQMETIDQSSLPGVKTLFSPRVGFNWDVTGDRTTQLRGGTGIFTGRLPFVWVGNVISNPGPNPNLYPNADPVTSKDDAVLQQSFDLNGMVDDFVWPQVWNSNIAVDHMLPGGILGTVEFIYGKDINSIYVRNANLTEPVRYLSDGRPYFTDASGSNRLNTFVPVDGDTIGFFGGVYVIDNSDEGYHYSGTIQLRKQFDFGLQTGLAYAYQEAKSLLKSTEIASVLFAENPVQGDPNKPELSYSEFGIRHRVTGNAIYSHVWNDNFESHFGLFFEVSEGNRFAGAGGNRYSFVYAGDVNGDGQAGNDLIYIPESQDDIVLVPYMDEGGNTISPEEQWNKLNAFIEQDDYLKEHRGEIAERFGAVNPWWWNIDFKFMQDFAFFLGGMRHTFQLSVDILNLPNMLSSEWGVRKIASSAATTPLELVGFDGNGEPNFNYKGTATTTYVDDPSVNSRWQMQVGLRYFFQ